MVETLGSQSAKTPKMSCISSFYVFLKGVHATNLKKNLKNSASKSGANVKRASLSLNFTSSYTEKECMLRRKWHLYGTHSGQKL